MSQEETTIEGVASVYISSFENFLRIWIDNDRLDNIMGTHQNYSGVTEFMVGVATSLPSGLPKINPLMSLFSERREILSKKKIKVLCEYTDLLLYYVIYIFKYYGYEFTMNGQNKIDEDEYNILLAKRLTKIYKIISKYIIGNPDLSIKEERTKTQINPKYREIFKLAQDLTMFQSIGQSIFGLSRGVSGETNYNQTPQVTPLHPSLGPSPPPSPRRGGTCKIRMTKRHRKTMRT
jgi:hypothetical protein